MVWQGNAVRLLIYIGESDRYQGKPLHMALLHYLKENGAAGATVSRGLAGFGARSRIHTASIVSLSEDLPLRLEWVDRGELVERLLPQIRAMVDGGLITAETLEVIQYAPGRRADPLSMLVADAMRADVTSAAADTPVAAVVSLLTRRGYRALPVLAGDGRLLGILTDGDLLRRGGVLARLRLQGELSEADRGQQMSALREKPQTAADIMTRQLVTLAPGDDLRHAMGLMVAHDLKRLPVVAGGVLAGWLSRIDLLRLMEYHQPVAPDGPPPAAAGISVTDLMVTDVAVVSPDTELEGILTALEGTRQRRVLVVDDQRRVLGIISDGDLLRRTRPPARRLLLNRLRALVDPSQKRADAALPAGETARALMSSPVIAIKPDTPLSEALRLLVGHQIKRLPVLDGEGRLLGLLGRGSLLRGLLAAEGDT